MTTLDLSHFFGTENWYRHPIFSNFTYTDGVKYVAEKAQAYWLLDLIILTYLERKEVYFQCFELNVDLKTKKAELVVTDGDDHLIKKEIIDSTDFPVEKVTIWVIDNVLLLPSEY